METCLQEDDHDGVVFLFFTYISSVPYTCTRLEQREFRSAGSVFALTLLLSFGRPSLPTLIRTFMRWLMEGRKDLVRVFCESSLISEQLLDMGISELESNLHVYLEVVPYSPMRNPLPYHRFLDCDLLESLGWVLLRRKRRLCLQYLRSYKNTHSPRTPDVSHREFATARSRTWA